MFVKMVEADGSLKCPVEHSELVDVEWRRNGANQNKTAGSLDQRYVENQVIRMFKGDEIPLSRRTITRVVDERLKIERDFNLIGRFLAEKREQVNRGRKIIEPGDG